MSIEKNINSRIVHKHDIEANWIKATNFIPKQGEIIIYDVDDNYSYPRFKIGDGLALINDLPFAMIQGDWNQNNINAIDFIKNKTHYVIEEEKQEIVLTSQADRCNEMILGNKSVHAWFGSIDNINYFIDNNYIITFDDETYQAFGKEVPNQQGSFIGNGSFLSNLNLPDTGESFCIATSLGDFGNGLVPIVAYITTDTTSSTHNVSITQIIPEVVQKLDPKYYERLGWKEKIVDKILFQGLLLFNESGQLFVQEKVATLHPDLNYTVTIDENVYEAGKPKIITIDGIPMTFLGNIGMSTNTLDPDTAHLPFLFLEQSLGTQTMTVLLAYEDNTFTTPLNGLHNITITESGDIIHKIPEEYYDKLAWEKDPFIITLISEKSVVIEDKTIGIACENILDDIPGILQITWDGILYDFISTKEIAYNNIEGYYVGNPYYLDKQKLSNSIPFAIWFDPDQYESYLFGEAGSHTYTVKCIIENIQRVPNNLLPLATSEARGAVAPEAKTDIDIQPVTIDENGKLWTEPTSNTIVRDDDNGNVVLISLATQNHENIVTDDGDGNVEVQSTSMYNPFPGIENAEIGQTVEIAEVDINGFPTKWNAVDAGANGNIFIVTVENDSITGQLMASATPAEILEQAMQNKIIFMPMEGLSCNLVECTGTQAAFIALIPNTENLFFGIITIAEDRTITLESDTIDFTQFITTSQYNQDKTLLINELNNKITRPGNAEVGQVLSVKTVNTNGVPTAWEAITLSSGGASTPSIPTPTTADAGKFLRVSAEGLYILENMTNAMEVSF